ncbi:MAG: acyl-CoA thioesterase [Promethearchaeota archaeon]|nr:MAG: acyl-CoA thioesterase [Candidatus Lokiarchaeota archaeon]
MMPSNANPKGNVQGGTIMKIVDDAALIVAERHSHKNCVTASIDRLDFISPVYVGNAVFAKASINYVSKTSMEICVLVEAECLKTGVREHVASAYLTFVALDKNDKPTQITQIIPETEEEKRRYLEAKERRRRRLKYIKDIERNPDCIARV